MFYTQDVGPTSPTTQTDTEEGASPSLDNAPVASVNVPAELSPLVLSQLLEAANDWKTLQNTLNLTPRKGSFTVGGKKRE